MISCDCDNRLPGESFFSEFCFLLSVAMRLKLKAASVVMLPACVWLHPRISCFRNVRVRHCQHGVCPSPSRQNWPSSYITVSVTHTIVGPKTINNNIENTKAPFPLSWAVYVNVNFKDVESSGRRVSGSCAQQLSSKLWVKLRAWSVNPVSSCRKTVLLPFRSWLFQKENLYWYI